MKKTLLFLLLIIICSCHSSTHYLTQAEIENDTISEIGTFDTLAAYRKRPGGAKTEYVKGYYRKDGKYIKGHYKTPKSKQ